MAGDSFLRDLWFRGGNFRIPQEQSADRPDNLRSDGLGPAVVEWEALRVN